MTEAPAHSSALQMPVVTTAQHQEDCTTILAGTLDRYIPGRGCKVGNGSSVRLVGTASELLEGMSAMDGAWSSGLLVRADGRDEALVTCGKGVLGIDGCLSCLLCLMPACNSCCGNSSCCVLRRSPVNLFIIATNVSLQEKLSHSLCALFEALLDWKLSHTPIKQQVMTRIAGRQH